MMKQTGTGIVTVMMVAMLAGCQAKYEGQARATAAAQNAETAAGRAEAAARRVETAAGRAETAAQRAEAIVEKIESEKAPHRRR